MLSKKNSPKSKDHSAIPKFPSKPFLPSRLLVVVLGSFLLAGCVTTKYTREITEIREGQPMTTKEGVTIVSHAGPFGSVDKTLHTFTSKTGATDGDTATIGQDATNIDNTKQVEALNVAGSVLSDIVVKIMEKYIAAQTAGVSEVASNTETADKITTLTQLIAQLKALGVLKGR